MSSLYDRFAATESEINRAAECVNHGYVNEHHRPAVRYVENVAGEINPEKT